MDKYLVSGFRHMGIIVKDMDASVHFYQKLLGLKIIQDYYDDSPYINEITGVINANVHMVKMECPDGVVLELLEYLNHPTALVDMPIYNVGCCHIAFRVQDIESTYKKLLKSGVTLISKPVLSSEKIAKVCFCLDPNNIRVELVEMIE